MLEYIKQNILDITSGYICQQVNCQGVMGSGLAKQIKEKYPKVFNSYKTFCKKYGLSADKYDLLGQVNFVTLDVKNHLSIANIFGQCHYGRTNTRYTNYVALFDGLKEAVRTAKLNNVPIYIPKNIGCGLAHGDWTFVETYLADLSEFFNKDIIIVELSADNTQNNNKEEGKNENLENR